LSQKNLNKELDLLFRSLKVKKGDKVIIHSNIAGIFQFYKKNKKDTCDVFISYLKKYIGKKGVVVIPAYNYKFTKMKDFNVRTSASEVGFFSNYLLKKHWRKRTLDPIFSHIIFGKINNFDHKKINYEAFGVNSIFSILKENNFKIICFCCPTNTMTFLHYLEYLFDVPYRYIKNFKGMLINQKFKTEINYKYNVGKKSSNYSIQEHKTNKLINQKDFIKSYFGRFECYSVNCNYLYYILMKKMKINKKFLII
tara:strand:- start:476 stop:1234 length:759 start_codon:yes stop_codon:yes gene_type:complete